MVLRTGWLPSAADSNEVVRLLYHYTNEAGAIGIRKSGIIRANSSNRVYVTTQRVPLEDANAVLFAGNPDYLGRGEFVVQIEARFDLPFEIGVQPNELIHYGSLRDDRNIRIVNIFENPFGK